MPHFEQGTVNFPGILAPVGGRYALTRGINPGIIEIHCCNQRIENFRGATGSVIFQHQSTGFYLELINCRVFHHDLMIGGTNKELTIALEDRRWLWRFPSISGCYNRKTADQTIYKNYRKNPQELAKLCLEAMDEKGYDVSALPTNDYPPIEWYASNAAAALENLVNLYGCCTTLNLNGYVVICKIGVGNPLPLNLPYDTNNEAIIAPILPDSYEVHFGPTKYRVNSLLQSVAIDVDGVIKGANEVSYKPKVTETGGTPQYAWDTEIPGTFPVLLTKELEGNAHSGQRLFIMDLARKSMFKYFQISTYQPDPSASDQSRGAPMEIPGCKIKIEDIDQLLPIDDTLYNVCLDPSATAQDLKNNRFNQVSDTNSISERLWDVVDLSLVWGTFFKSLGHFIGTAKQTSEIAFKKPEGENSYNAGGYQIDKERGIVMFDDYVYKMTNPDDVNNSKRTFPDLALSFMTSVRDRKTGAFDHYTYKRDSKITKKNGTKPQVIMKPEYQLVVTHEMLNGGNPGPAKQVNKKMLDQIAEYYINFVEQTSLLQNPQTIRYNGLQAVNPDGAVVSVTFEVGGGGAKTTASYNDERHPWLQPYETRRLNERTRQGINQFGFIPPAFFFAPRAFPYNMGSVFSNVQPSRR